MQRTPSRIVRRSAPAGFTLLELMVVVVIIVGLIAILIPSLAAMKKAATKAAAKAQMNALQQGLAQYFQDFNMYPASSPLVAGGTTQVYTLIKAGRGPDMLAEAMVGYLDGDADGAGAFKAPNQANSDPSNNGFRISKAAAVMGGKVYGPYTGTDPKQYKISIYNGPTRNDQYFIDPWGNEILYYRANPRVTGVPVKKIFDTAANASTAYFIAADCQQDPDPSITAPRDPISKGTGPFFQMLGSGPNNNASGLILGADSYLLISAGPDGIYFNADDVVVGK